MDVTFFHDRDTGLPHISNHNVEPSEVVDVLDGAEMDYHQGDGVRVAVGQTAAGRYLRVVYRRLDDGTRFVITAFDLPGKAKAALKRQRRRRR